MRAKKRNTRKPSGAGFRQQDGRHRVAFSRIIRAYTRTKYLARAGALCLQSLRYEGALSPARATPVLTRTCLSSPASALQSLLSIERIACARARHCASC